MNYLINIYKKTATPVKASIWFVVCSVIHKSMYFIMIPIYTHIMTTEQYGKYSIFSSVVSLVITFAGLNLAGNSFNVGMIRNENKKDEYTTAILGLWWLNTTLCFFLMYLFRNIWFKFTGLDTEVLIAVFIDIYATAGFDLWTVRQKFDYKYKLLLLLTISLVITTTISSIIAVSFSRDKGIAAIWSKVIVFVIHSIITCFLIFKRSKSIINITFWKKAYLFNIPLIGYYLSLTVLNQSDRLMINAYKGHAEAGIYSVAYSLAMIFTLLNSAISSAFTPWAFRKIKIGELKSISKISNFILIFIGAINIILIALAPEIISILTVKEYYDAIWIIPPVALSSYLMCLYQLFVDVEFYYEKNKFVMVASILVAILNIILNGIFIPKYGYIAAAYTTLVSYLCFTIIHYIFMMIICRINNYKENIYDISFIFLFSLIIFLLAFLFLAVYRAIIIRYILLIVFCTLILMFCFNHLKGINYNKKNG